MLMKKKNPYQLELEFKRTEYQTEFSLTQADEPGADKAVSPEIPQNAPKVKISTSTSNRFYKTKK